LRLGVFVFILLSLFDLGRYPPAHPCRARILKKRIEETQRMKETYEEKEKSDKEESRGRSFRKPWGVSDRRMNGERNKGGSKIE